MTQALKTYAESRGEQAYDWNAALQKALRNEPGLYVHTIMSTKALSWVTCACGNQCDVIPRHLNHPHHGNGSPVDARLRELGGDFFAQVNKRQWVHAIDTLAKIEKRSAELICEIVKKLKEDGNGANS